MGQCFVNVTEVRTKIPEIIQDMNLTEEQMISKLVNLVKFDQRSVQIVQDLVQSRWYLLGALFVVVFICFIYILLLRWVPGQIVWSSIIGLAVLQGFCILVCFMNYAYFEANPTTHTTSTFSDATFWLVILIALAVWQFIFLFIVIYLRKQISIAIKLIREGSKAVIAIKSTIFFPIIPWLLQCLVIAYGMQVLMNLLSIGESAFRVVKNEDYQNCNPALSCHDPDGGACRFATCQSTQLASPYRIFFLHLANLLGFCWTMFFISGVSDMILASTFSTWFWTYDKKDLPFFTLTSGIYRTLRYHLGTVALGALILAIVRVIRVISKIISESTRGRHRRHLISFCIMCLCKYFCRRLEIIIKFINKNAYIMCAVHGHGFCKSARDAFSLLMRNIVRVIVLKVTTGVFFGLSKLLISIGVGIAMFYLLQWNLVYEVSQGQALHYNYIPAIILSIATYFICTIFFNVYEMAIDTLFLCFLEDCERNDGSPEKPYFMSRNLMKILRKDLGQ